MDISAKLLSWYRQNKRELPWRDTQNPYYIWLSEIILQQTRVNQGMNYYLRFVQHYPTVSDLAHAPEEKILKDWQGLGYYSRARNLHAAAKSIVANYGGEFPATYEAVRSLKGVGDYTAAAITSIAYGLPYPVLDGNVYRVISRLFAITEPIDTPAGKNKVKEALAAVFDPTYPGEFNQAMMEFGALYCVPRNPDCNNCIAYDTCMAREQGLVDQIPFKSKTTKIRSRYFYYLVIEQGDEVFLEKRQGKDIWEGLFQFPLLETEKSLSLKQLEKHPELTAMLGEAFSIAHASIEYKHVLSHQHLYATFLILHPEKKVKKKIAEKWIAVKKENLEEYAVPRLIHKFLEQYLSKENKLL